MDGVAVTALLMMAMLCATLMAMQWTLMQRLMPPREPRTPATRTPTPHLDRWDSGASSAGVRPSRLRYDRQYPDDDDQRN